VEENLRAEPLQVPDHRGPGGREQLHADLEEGDLAPERADDVEGFVSRRSIQGDNQLGSLLHRRLIFTNPAVRSKGIAVVCYLSWLSTIDAMFCELGTLRGDGW